MSLYNENRKGRNRKYISCIALAFMYIGQVVGVVDFDGIKTTLDAAPGAGANAISFTDHENNQKISQLIKDTEFFDIQGNRLQFTPEETDSKHLLKLLFMSFKGDCDKTKKDTSDYTYTEPLRVGEGTEWNIIDVENYYAPGGTPCYCFLLSKITLKDKSSQILTQGKDKIGFIKKIPFKYHGSEVIWENNQMTLDESGFTFRKVGRRKASAIFGAIKQQTITLDEGLAAKLAELIDQYEQNPKDKPLIHTVILYDTTGRTVDRACRYTFIFDGETMHIFSADIYVDHPTDTKFITPATSGGYGSGGAPLL